MGYLPVKVTRSNALLLKYRISNKDHMVVCLHIILFPYECRRVRIGSSFCHFLCIIKPFYCYENSLKISITVLRDYKNMSKEEMIQEVTDINSSFVNDINTKLTDFSEKFKEFTSKYDTIFSKLHHCKSSNFHRLTMVIQLECNSVTN